MISLIANKQTAINHEQSSMKIKCSEQQCRVVTTKHSNCSTSIQRHLPQVGDSFRVLSLTQAWRPWMNDNKQTKLISRVSWDAYNTKMKSRRSYQWTVTFAALVADKLFFCWWEFEIWVINVPRHKLINRTSLNWVLFPVAACYWANLWVVLNSSFSCQLTFKLIAMTRSSIESHAQPKSPAVLSLPSQTKLKRQCSIPDTTSTVIA